MPEEEGPGNEADIPYLRHGSRLEPAFYLYSALKGAFVTSGELEMLRAYGSTISITKGQVICAMPDKPIPRS
jgi:hypothetical protein